MNGLNKKIISVLIVLISMAGLIYMASQGQERRAGEMAYTKDLFVMDTYFALKAYGPEAEAALEQCEAKVLQLEERLSVTRNDSDVSKINNGTQTVVSKDTFMLIQEALKLCEETQGALDITLYPVLRAWGFTTDIYCVPEDKELESLLKKVDYRNVEEDANQSIRVPEGSEIDLGAVAKGYTGDCLIAILRECGVTSAMLDLGGNVQTLGNKPDNSPWKIAVRDPYNIADTVGVLDVSDKCVITSGNYERYFEENGKRYGHILDPKDGYPADSGLMSVTIVGDSGVRCDGLSTALFVMGEDEAIDFWQKNGDFEMILVTEDKELLVTEGLQECFVCSEEWNAKIIQR